MIQLWNDSMTMAGRNILRLRRNPQMIFFTLVQPVFFVLIFNFVFGGSIQTETTDYANYLIPGVLIQTLAFAGSNTAIVLAHDANEGSTDRFLSLPIRRSAVLIGRTLADSTRFVLTSIVIVLMGVAIGFRFGNGFLAGVAALGLAVLFGFTFSWVYVTLGLLSTNVETVQSASFVPTLFTTFASSAFVPVDSLPGWLQVFAKRQPVTVVVDSIRGLTEAGLPVAKPLLWSMAWMAALLAIFIPFGTRLFGRN